MITGPTFATFEEAYLAVLREVSTAAQYDTRTRAKTAREIINTSFTIADPTTRTAYLAARKANVVFNHAETLWYLAGRDDLEMMAYYAPRLTKLSLDGQTLTGTAYGPRLFGTDRLDGRSQYERVLELLRTDPDAKRANMIIMRPDELVDPTNPDVACTLGLQFMLRGGALHATAYMRGNDAMIGLVGDTFAFTFIQELAARELGVQVGTYAHHVGSMHINVNDLTKVERILTDAADGAWKAPAFDIPVMPDGSNWPAINEVLAWEANLRMNRVVLTPEVYEGLELDVYWRQVIALFEVYRQITHHVTGPVSDDAVDLLHPGHRWLVRHRWPDRMPTALTAGAGA